jgi:hypothetical protein
MKIKKEYIIIALIIIGLSIYLIGRKTDRTLYELPEVHAVDQKDLTRIEIAKGKESIVLSKKDESWYIEPQGYAADAKKVKAMLDTLDDLTVTALVSESKDYIRYDLGAEDKINVKAWQADSLKREFDVGKSASSFRHTFVKLADDERVFHARDNFRNTFDQTRDDLRDKKVLAFTKDDIKTIQISTPKQSLTIAKTEVPSSEKKDAASSSEEKDEAASTEEKTDEKKPAQTVWQTPEGQTADNAVLNRVLSTLSNLSCQGFIEDRKKDSFTDAEYNFQATDSQTHYLSIYPKFKEEDKNYPATSSGSEYAFLLSDSQVEQIREQADKIIPAPKEAAAEGKKGAEQTESSNKQSE